MSICVVFHTLRDSCMIDWPDEPVLKALRTLDDAAVGCLFGVGDMPESELAGADEPSLVASRNDLLSASESLLSKLGPRGSVEVEIVGFACKVGTRKTQVGSGETGFFQLSGSDKWYKLDASLNGSCELRIYERTGSDLKYVGSEHPAPGTEIQPVSYDTTYIIGARRRRIRIAREFQRLRDFLLSVQEPRIRVSLVV